MHTYINIQIYTYIYIYKNIYINTHIYIRCADNPSRAPNSYFPLPLYFFASGYKVALLSWLPANARHVLLLRTMVKKTSRKTPSKNIENKRPETRTRGESNDRLRIAWWYAGGALKCRRYRPNCTATVRFIPLPSELTIRTVAEWRYRPKYARRYRIVNSDGSGAIRTVAPRLFDFN